MGKYPGLALVVGNRKKVAKLGIKPGSVQKNKKGEKCIVQYNGDLRPVRPGELDEPYHRAKKES